IDAYAKATPESKTKDIETLVKYLMIPAREDSEKVRSIFTWETSHITYDWAAYQNGTYSSQQSATTLKRRKGVCQNFSDLFTDLCNAAGLEAHTISGYAKSNVDNSWMLYGFTSINHAWNVVKVNNHWELMVVTWAQNIGSTIYFMADPKIFREDHLPAETKWQMMRDTISLKQFEHQPILDDGYKSLGITHLTPMASSIKGNIAGRQAKKFVFEFDCKKNLDVKARVSDYYHSKEAKGSQVITHTGNHYKLELTIENEGTYWVILSEKSYFVDIASYVLITE
ncbi:MAG: hypothetical protein LH473_03395, partial [Chitinophagales bacterium]|nr:hypothetical protein [Chitinophagales bacterium]